jgi:FkbM family methyltransferase
MPIKLDFRPYTSDQKVIDELLVKKVYDKIGFEHRDHWLDLGAHIGLFTLIVKYKTEMASVLAYEPDLDNFNLLYENTIGLHGVVVKNRAISTNNKVANLYLAKSNYRHSILHVRGRRTIQVEVCKFKDVLQEYSNINAIKMDIEGSEIAILEDMMPDDWCKTKVKKMVFEYSFSHDRSVDRFLGIIQILFGYFDRIDYPKQLDSMEGQQYTFHPEGILVFCWKVDSDSIPKNNECQ